MKVTFDIDDETEICDALDKIAKAHGWNFIFEQAGDDWVHDYHDDHALIDRYTTRQLLNAVDESDILAEAEDIRPKQFLTLVRWPLAWSSGRVSRTKAAWISF